MYMDRNDRFKEYFNYVIPTNFNHVYYKRNVV